MLTIKRFHLSFGSFIVLITLLLTACNELDPKNENDVRDFLTDWNTRHSALKSVTLKHEYMDLAMYYGTELTKEQIQQHKNYLFQTFPDYQQEIVEGSIEIERVGADYIISFTRNISFGNTALTVPSFLNVSSKNSEFRILREGIQETQMKQELRVLFPTRATLENNFGERRKLYGDFNGDGLSDYAWIEIPKSETTTSVQSNDCLQGCERTVRFSNETLQAWQLEGIFEATLENLSDLNGDGADEVGLWSKSLDAETLYVWDANNNRSLVEPLTINTRVHKNLKLIDVLKKSGVKKITVTESVEINGAWELKSKVVTLD